MSKSYSLPLVIKPENGKRSVEDLKQWIATNKDVLDENLENHGAILFRGFEVEKGIDFQDIIQQFNPNLCDEYRGTSPRRLISGTKYVFTASELPPSFPIPQHLEMSFLPAPPRRLFFCCLEAPTCNGGETSLCDYRKVLQDLDPKIRQEFELKGIEYIRNYPMKKTILTDPLTMKGWPDVFSTTDKSVVEKELQTTNMNYKWTGDHLSIKNKASAIEKHPETGDSVWFNHLAVFHYTSIYQEMNYFYERVGGLYFRLYGLFHWLLLTLFILIKGADRLGMHTRFGDGSQIPEQYVTHLRSVIHKNMVYNRWMKGDIVMIDNFRVSHGRQPYNGKRKIVVSWSEPQQKPSMLVEQPPKPQPKPSLLVAKPPPPIQYDPHDVIN